MKILIIGAGWYGCHLAKYLIKRGIDFVIVDKSNDIFTGSSSKNQNRLHLGFHYPRSDATIVECLKGYTKFLNKYLHLTHTFDNNLYFISSINSLIDINTYKERMSHHCIQFVDFNDKLPIDIKNIQKPILTVKEKYINPFEATKYFRKILAPYFKTIDNSNAFESIDCIKAELNTNFDLIINCTYNALNPISFTHYELFVTLLYKIPDCDVFSYTIMDGPFFSIYPYDLDNKIYTVTSVVHGVAYKGTEHNFQLGDEQLNDIKVRMEKQIIEFIPDWFNKAEYVSYFTSWKTKHDLINDDRSLKYLFDNGILNFYGGKITGIFEAEDILNSLLKVHFQL